MYMCDKELIHILPSPFVVVGQGMLLLHVSVALSEPKLKGLKKPV